MTKKQAGPESRVEGLFRGLSENEISPLLNAAQPRSERRGAFFYQEGDSTRGIYLLTKGRVRLFQGTAGGRHALLRFINSGDAFGFIGLLYASHAISAQAMEDSEALFWNRNHAMRFLESNSKLAWNLFTLAARNINDLRERHVYLLTQPAESRVAWALARLAERVRRKGTQFLIVPRVFGKKDLADMAGTTIYTVSRVLSKWTRAGIIANDHGEILVQQPKALSQIAGALS